MMILSALLFSIALVASYFGFLPQQGAILAIEPITIIGGAIALGGLVSGLIGAGASRAQAEEAARLIEQSIKDYDAIGIPREEALRISLRQFSPVGELTPEQEETIVQQDSEFKKINEDPLLKEAQMSALLELQGIGQSGGMRLQDLADREKVLGDIAQRARGANEAVKMDMLQRGGYGSGAELAARLHANDTAASAARQAGLDLAGRAEERALQAIMAGGTLGGQIRGQDWSQAAQVANAQDAINRYNAMNSQDVIARNTKMKNYATERNLGERQRISDANVNISNMQEQYNKSIPMQLFDANLRKTAGKANARAGQANVIGSMPNPWGGIGQSMVGMGGILAAQGLKDKMKPTKLKASAMDIEEDEDT